MKQYLFAFGALLLLVGAGCGSTAPTETTDTTPTAKDAGSEETMADDSLMEDELFLDNTAMDGDIMLSAEARGDGEVYFEWEVPEGTEYDGFVLVRGEEVDPVNDGTNYWFRQFYTRRAVTWTELPAGEWNVRICGLDGDECAAYSNNVVVTVE